MSESIEVMKSAQKVSAKSPEPVIIPVEAYISEEYLRAERDKMWRKVWLQAGRQQKEQSMKMELLRTKKNTPNAAVSFRAVHEKKTRKICNLCKTAYSAGSRFERFCPSCKENSELYHFSEWLSAS